MFFYGCRSGLFGFFKIQVRLEILPLITLVIPSRSKKTLTLHAHFDVQHAELILKS